MRRVIAPALLALFVFAGSSAQAGFGLFDRLCNRGCDAPACCEAVEPVCGCEVVEPTCGCEVVDPCCSARPKLGGLLKKIFSCKSHSCCEPVCGCEVAPVDCGCAVVEPACGCEPAPCCDIDPCAAPRKPLFRGMLKKLLHKHHSHDCCAEPVCGCEVVEPSCGCGA